MRAVAILALGLAACGGDRHPRTVTSPADAVPAPVNPVVGVELEVLPAGALVSIDETDRGPAATLARVIALEPGLHRLIVTFDGYKPYRAEFMVSNKTEHFTVHLRPAR